MTPVQSSALEFIKGYWTANRHSPSFREIGKNLGTKSSSRVWDVVHALEDRGYITTRPGCGRSIKLVENCPHCGGKL